MLATQPVKIVFYFFVKGGWWSPYHSMARRKNITIHPAGRPQNADYRFNHIFLVDQQPP
jgi:hypothetical protein